MSLPNIPAAMRSPIFAGQGRVEWVEKTVPSPGPGQLLLQSKANALCGSEKGFYLNGSAELTPGHEAAGVVVAAGPGTKIEVGTRGVVFLMDFCGECRSCRLGYTNQCLHKRADMGFTHDGGYGPYMLVHENIFFPIDDDVSFTDATLLLDVMGTGGHAIRRARLARPDIESVLVAGAGPIGLALLAMAKIMLGKDVPVFITDVTDYRLELAQKMGGIPIRADRAELSEELRKHGLAEVDAAFDSSGRTEARRQAVDVLGKRGALVCVGHGGGLSLDVSPDLIAAERTVLGSEYFAFAELAENSALLQEHLEELRPIITHRYPAEELQQAAELFFSGQCGKVVVEHE
jgi:Threonine dehydrogenase and related Zn-dependent dehydrogenases